MNNRGISLAGELRALVQAGNEVVAEDEATRTAHGGDKWIATALPEH